MAKGKKEDPNKVAQRKAQRVAFVQSRPDLAPEVARKRFYVQTRAQELEAAGKPVDRAALRQKFETGGVTREGFYTPADIARINARKNVNNGTGSLADTKTTPSATPSAPVKNPPVGGVVGAPTAPPSTTKTPTKSKPQSRPPDRIQDTVVVAGATQKSPDVQESRARVAKMQPTKAQIDEANVYNNLVKKYGGNEKLAQAAYQLTVGGGEKVTPIESALFGKGVSAKTFVKEQSGIPQIGRGIEELKTGKGITGKLRGIKDVALGGFQLAGNIAMLKGGASRLSKTSYFNEPLAISQRFELPAAGQTGKFGAAVRAEEARVARIQAEREAAGWGAGVKTPVEAGPAPMTRAQVAEQRRLQRQAAVKERQAAAQQTQAPSLAEVKQAEIDAQIEAGIKAATEKPVAEAPAVEIKTKGKGGKGGKGKTKTVKQEAAPVGTRIDEIDLPDGSAKFVDEDFVFDEMSSVDRPTGDAYLYDPKADLGNLADVKAETKINYADIKAKTETPAVEVKGKGKGNKGGKGKNKSTVEPKPAETVATTPEAKPVKKKTTVELATQPRGKQSIAPSIELKQGTKPGQVMGQASARMSPVPGEITNPAMRTRTPRQIREAIAKELRDNPFEAGVPKGEPKSALGRLEGESVREITSKGGRPKKVTEGTTEFDLSGMHPRAQRELSGQAELELDQKFSGLRLRRYEVDMSRSRQSISKTKRWLIMNKQKGTLSESGQSLLDRLTLAESDLRLQGRLQIARMDQGTYMEMVRNPQKSTKTKFTGAEAPKGGLMSDKIGRGRVPTAEGFEKTLKRLFPTINRLEKKTTLTQVQAKELEAAYKSLYNASPTDAGRAEWQGKNERLANKIKNKEISIIIGRAKGKK